ncbi:MAG: hypothetical protein ACKN9S_15560 [Pirellula sp.]
MIKHGGRHMECAYYDEPSPIGGQSTMPPSLRSTLIDNLAQVACSGSGISDY